VAHALASDAIGAWLGTFTHEELMHISCSYNLFSFGFFAMVLMAMTCGFTANGYLIQLVYVLIVEKGSYCKGIE
jgi:hypothetical protein